MKKIHKYDYFLEKVEIEEFIKVNEGLLTQAGEVAIKAVKALIKKAIEKYNKLSAAGKRKLVTSVAAILIANGAVTTFSALFSNDKLEDNVEIYSNGDGVDYGEDGPYVPEGLPIDKNGSPVGMETTYDDVDDEGEVGPYVPEGLPIDKDGSPIGFTDKIIAPFIEEVKTEIKKTSKYNKGYKFTLSDKGRDIIKKHEGFSDTGYRLKDGRITIGWGHAERVAVSKYKHGQKITMEEAKRLFKEDSTNAAKGVRNIFKQWEEQGVEVLITQDMFDALVSVTYNAGIGNVRKSQFIQDLKRGDIKNMVKNLKTFKLSENYKSSLAERRKKEVKQFLGHLK